MRVQLAIVGGGPAGLALATAAARRGVSTLVLERQALPADKACGEGLMPAGVTVLDWLGVTPLLGPEDASPLRAIRYVREDGVFADGALPAPGGLGVRRLALSRALTEAALAAGAQLRTGCRVETVARAGDGMEVRWDGGGVEASLVVAADGLHSPLRHAMGLDAGAGASARRFGIRRHYRLPPWSSRVEVHLGPGAEAYVTPAGSARVGIAILWEPAPRGGKEDFDGLLARFPALREHLAGAEPDSEVRGAGPFLQGARARTLDRFALLGDAAGYVDAITGEGISLALVSAWILASQLPAILERGATREALALYEETLASDFRRYARVAEGVLMLARRPWLRRQAIGLLASRPSLFDALLRWVMAGERIHRLPEGAREPLALAPARATPTAPAAPPG